MTKEEEWLTSNPSYVTAEGVRAFPNGAAPLTEEQVHEFALLGKPGLEHMIGKVLGITPETYRCCRQGMIQDTGKDTFGDLIDLISGIHLEDEDQCPGQEY